MTKILKIIGIIAVCIIIFILGYAVGRTPSTLEDEQKSYDLAYKTDLTTLVGNYHQLYNLCEQKYQLGIDGNMNGAFQVKGQMGAVENIIQGIESKYKINPL